MCTMSVYLVSQVTDRFIVVSIVSSDGTVPLFFLRLLLPALTLPHLYGITKNAPSQPVRYVLIHVSRLLQSAANHTGSDSYSRPARIGQDRLSEQFDTLIGEIESLVPKILVTTPCSLLIANYEPPKPGIVLCQPNFVTGHTRAFRTVPQDDRQPNLAVSNCVYGLFFRRI